MDAESGPAGGGLAAATINHCLAVLSSFYDEHVRAGTIDRSPVPAVGDGRHRSPMEPRRLGRRAPLRQRTPATVLRGLTDTEFTLLFAAMTSDRDRALLGLFALTGARAGELLGLRVDEVRWGDQLVGVTEPATPSIA